MQKLIGLAVFYATVILSLPATADGLSPFANRLEEVFLQVEEIARDPLTIATVEAANSRLFNSEYNSMDNQKWQKLAVRDPLVQTIIQSELSRFLRHKLTSNISEAFVNDLKGNKVAMLAKSTRWCHAGTEKHDVTLKGQRWVGNPEFDDSTGTNQVQIAVPVFGKKNTVIGTIIVGIKIASLR